MHRDKIHHTAAALDRTLPNGLARAVPVLLLFGYLVAT